ncbi:hypothetical protein FJ422_30400 [Mesorhizobium sp. B2-6-3]|nr:hypothetical protein FJ422_30400 [Mesorhizobium sp. B2-6-3]
MIVASGPSASGVPLDIAKGRARCIAINTSWRLCPWADILFACDVAWWDHAAGCPEFTRLKLTVDRKAVEKYACIRQVDCRKPDDRLVVEPVNTVGWGGNGGFHALNLAVQFGCRKIILVGYDMTIKAGIHWHGNHPHGMNNPKAGNVERWRRAVDAAWQVIEPLGIKVINCSPISALRNYPKMTLAEALSA